MENNKNKKSMKFQGAMLNFYDFIQVFIFTRNHHLNENALNSEGSLMHYKARPSNYLFQLFLTL